VENWRGGEDPPGEEGNEIIGKGETGVDIIGFLGGLS